MPENAFAANFILDIEGLGQRLEVHRFEGVEALSELYHFELFISSEDGEIAFDDVVGKKALLTILLRDEPRYVHGVVSRFEQTDEGLHVTGYEVTLVPRVFRLLHRHTCCIFQEQSVPQIIEQVLKTAGIQGGQYRSALVGSYRTRDYCVQYREADWVFVERLMEEEGIYYFFEHTGDDHVLVFADDPSAHPPIQGDPTLPFRPPSGALFGGEHVSRLRYAEEVRPGKVTVRDYNFKRPELLLEGRAEAPRDADLEVYDYPGEYDLPAEGSTLARVRLEQWQAVRKLGKGESSCLRFAAGAFFSLADHPHDAFNQRYLITRVEHQGARPRASEPGGSVTMTYQNRFAYIPGSVPFRAQKRTPRPTIKGIQTAIVVGPSGEEIHTDEHGRVKVQFHWDRKGKRDAQSSCWIRVSQVWAGAAWGAMYIPRIGQEVVVDFLEGDPDRPLIVGRVYHGANVPPYPLPAEKTKSTLKSSSSPGGGGYNELRFEDRKGQEEIFLHGQKDFTITILNDKDQQVGHDESLKVGGDRQKSVGGDQSETIGRDATASIGRDFSMAVIRNQSEQIGGNRNTTVSGNQSEEVIGDRTIAVTGRHEESINAAMSLSVGGDKTERVSGATHETVSGNKDVGVDGDYAVAVKKQHTVAVEGDATEDVNGQKTVTVGEKITIACGEVTVTVEKNGNITVEGKDITLKATGKIAVEGQQIDVKSSGSVNVTASGSAKIKGSSIDMN